MADSLDTGEVEATYAELLKERMALEKQLAEAGIPFDRTSAVRFYMSGVKAADPQVDGELEKRIGPMAEKMPADLPPDRFPDAEQRERRMKYLASIQENWDWIEAHSTFPVKAPWDTETMLVEQLPKHLPLNKTLAHIWKMRIQEKAASGDVSGALADFSRSRADALISKVLKNLSKDKYERASDIARRCNCSSVEIHDYIGHRAECYFCHTKFYISSQECGDNEYETTTVKEPRS